VRTQTECRPYRGSLLIAGAPLALRCSAPQRGGSQVGVRGFPALTQPAVGIGPSLRVRMSAGGLLIAPRFARFIVWHHRGSHHPVVVWHHRCRPGQISAPGGGAPVPCRGSGACLCTWQFDVCPLLHFPALCRWLELKFPTSLTAAVSAERTLPPQSHAPHPRPTGRAGVPGRRAAGHAP
jgi:hypothetical protein